MRNFNTRSGNAHMSSEMKTNRAHTLAAEYMMAVQAVYGGLAYLEEDVNEGGPL